MSGLDVSIVLPVFNEAGHLQDEIDRIRKAMDNSPFSYEIIVVDDGSTDGSGERLREIEGIRLMQFATNRGSGSARKYGSMAAQGTIVVWTDVDMTYPNDEIPQLIEHMDGYDHVVGARTSEQGTVKLLRTPAKWFIRKLASYLTGVKIPDLNSGFRAFRNDIGAQFYHLLPRGFSCVTTLTMSFLTNGYSVRYVPIEYTERAGRSKFHWWSDTRRYILQVVRLALSYFPLRLFGPPVAILLASGLVKVVYDIVDKDFRIATNTIVLVAAGLVLALLGMLADLVVHLTRPRLDVLPTWTDAGSD